MVICEMNSRASRGEPLKGGLLCLLICRDIGKSLPVQRPSQTEILEALLGSLSRFAVVRYLGINCLVYTRLEDMLMLFLQIFSFEKEKRKKER